MDFAAFSLVKEVSIDALVIRGNGYRENLGRIGYWDKSLLRRLQWKLSRRPSGLYAAMPFLALDPACHGYEKGLITALSLAFALGATLQVNSGQAIVTNRIHGAGTEPLQQGWGTSAGTTAATDTTLFGEKAADLATGSGSRTGGTGSQVTGTNTNDTYQVTATITATGAGTVTNAGLFDNATIGSGNLYMKGDFTGIALAVNDSIAFTNKVRYA